MDDTSVITTTRPSTPSASSSICFDRDTQRLLDRLHRAWASRAPASTYAAICSAVLRQREHLDTRILTVAAVVQLACPSALADEENSWSELFAAARQAADRQARRGTVGQPSESELRRRKRAHNESNRLRNLALVAALWSPALVAYYGWTTATQTQMNMLRACAVRYPRFNDDFRPRLNRVLLDRHRQGLQDARTQNLTQASLQPHRDFTLAVLAAAVPDLSLESLWTTNQDGHVPIDAHGLLFLRDLRPAHFQMYLLQYDKYGLLVSRNDTGFASSHSHNVAAVEAPFCSDTTEIAGRDLPSSSPTSTSSAAPGLLSDTSDNGLYSTDSGPSAEPSPVASPTGLHASPLGGAQPIAVPYGVELSPDRMPAYEQFWLGSSLEFDGFNTVDVPSLCAPAWRQESLNHVTVQLPDRHVHSIAPASPGPAPCSELSRLTADFEHLVTHHFSESGGSRVKNESLLAFNQALSFLKHTECSCSGGHIR